MLNKVDLTCIRAVTIPTFSTQRLKYSAIFFLCDWSREPAPLSQPISCRTKTVSGTPPAFPRLDRVFMFFL